MEVNVETFQLNDFGTNTTVKLNLIHNILSMQIPEVRFDLFQKIESVKSICAKKFGSESLFMQLYLQDKNGNIIYAMNDDDRDLGYYSPQDGYFIYVMDLNPNSITKELEDLSQVEKYMMSEEDYAKLPSIFSNFRKFKEEYLKARAQQAPPKEKNSDFLKEEAEKISVGMRCRITDLNRRGEVKYVGKIEGLGDGYFVGVKLDEPFLNSDGIVKGVKYFECPKKYGMFVRPNKLEVGDFPELDLDDEI